MSALLALHNGFPFEIPFLTDLGVEFVSAANGEAELRLPLQTRHMNSWQVAHGGVVMTLLDVAMAQAGRSLYENVAGGVTVEMKTTFVRPSAGAVLTRQRALLPPQHHAGVLRSRCAGRARPCVRQVKRYV
jgi:acyl-CoA thioesterase